MPYLSETARDTVVTTYLQFVATAGKQADVEEALAWRKTCGEQKFMGWWTREDDFLLVFDWKAAADWVKDFELNKVLLTMLAEVTSENRTHTVVAVTGDIKILTAATRLPRCETLFNDRDVVLSMRRADTNEKSAILLAKLQVRNAKGFKTCVDALCKHVETHEAGCTNFSFSYPVNNVEPSSPGTPKLGDGPVVWCKHTFQDTAALVHHLTSRQKLYSEAFEDCATVDGLRACATGDMAEVAQAAAGVGEVSLFQRKPE
ncbi:hypothetical protein DIPPA_23280 [Diplonema papillatum]|nr:hypothetical protein DIPPA_23280 [Diplonema papillatum]|eukprot:gene15970-24435_t